MNTKNRILSMVLAVAMFLSVISILPPVDVWAADGDVPEVELLDYELDGNEFTMIAWMTLSGGAVECYGFAYSINGNTTQYALTHEGIGKWEEFSHTITVDPGDEIWYQAIVRNEYGLEGKADAIFDVPEEPEIELDTPDITSHNFGEEIEAGEDVKFRWSKVDDAEEYEWELYENSKVDGDKLVSGQTSERYVTIDGTWFEGGKTYSFYVRAVAANSTSDWGSCTYLICVMPDWISVEEKDFQCGSDGGIGYIYLTSTIEWEAEVSGDWISINKASGTGDATIRVEVEPNYGDERTGSVIIHNELGDIYVTVYQHSGEMPYLTVSTSEIFLPANDSAWSFVISSNVSWEISCDSEWIRNISSETGYGDESIQILIDENTSTESRTAIITIDSSDFTRTVIIMQEGRSPIVGDINGDGAVTNKDRFLLNRYLAGMDGYTDIDLTIADIDGDGYVTEADAEYLTNHLAGIKGYESFPEPDAACLHTNCDAVYAGKTVFVNNTIKNDGVHSYYHMWHYVCKGCGEDLGVFQGDDNAVKGASEKNVACTYNSDGVCSCGAIDTTGYTSWTAKNITGKKIFVYDTPYSTDGSYGKIFVNESVKVLGSKAGRYLIEYTVTDTNAKKQGYVNANSLASASDYRLEFEFETITLPVSRRTVLLIPYDGSAYYHLYNGEILVWEESDLSNLTIVFNNEASCDIGLTTITGKLGGFGTMSAYYIENGNKIYLQTPDYYIVADSSSVYTTENINVFSEGEKEYISMALDIYFSQNDINVPYELQWSAGENFLLCIEELDEILVSLLQGESPTQNDYASILAEFITQYFEAEDSNTTVDEININWSNNLISLLDALQTTESNASVAPDLLNAIEWVNNLYRASKLSPEEFRILFERVAYIIKHNDFKYLVRDCLKLQEVMDAYMKDNMPISALASKLEFISKNDKLFKKGGVFDKICAAGDAFAEIEHIISFAFTVCGDWQRHRSTLIMILTTVESIPPEERERIKNYEALVGAVNLLLEKYDDEFINRLNGNLEELAAQTIVWGADLLLSFAFPGPMAIKALTQFIVSFGNEREEADIIRMRQFYIAVSQGILNEFEDLYNNGQTFSAFYSTANDTVKMFLNMAIYVNKLAKEANEYTDTDKAVFEKNNENIKKIFAIYLD